MADAIPQLDGASEIVITGVGLATCLGVDAETTWNAIVAGRCGVGPMSEMESPLPAGSVGGQAVDLPADFKPDLPREARYLRWSIIHALRNAGMDHRKPYAPERCFVMLGTTLHGIRAGGRFLRSDDARELRTFLAGATSGLALRGLGLEGGMATTCSACSSSLGAVALGVTLLQTGQADMVVAGGYDAISEYAWGGFNALRLVAEGPLRPFSRGRQGMKLAEGYGVVVLERASDAACRGAPIAAVLAGWGESADAHHLTQPHPQGHGALRAMTQAITRAGVRSTSIGMVAAHATGTPDNDLAEFQALSRLLEQNLPEVPVVGFKSHLGHTLGGAGIVELILSSHALRDQAVPPCASITETDIEFPGLNVATGIARKRDVHCTLNTSLGFGGANTCVVLARPEVSGEATERKDKASDRKVHSPEAWITGIGVLIPGIVGIVSFAHHAQKRDSRACRRGPIEDSALGDLLNVRRVRRLSPYVKYTLASAVLALRDAGATDHPDLIASASALLGSMHGSPSFCSEFYSQIVREGALAANPVLFAEGVPNAAAAHASTTLGIRGACQTIIGSRTAGLDALALAALRIRSGAAEMVLVSAAEESDPIIDRVYREFGLQAREDEETSLEASRGFLSVPGAVGLIVESSTSAAARGARPYAKVGEVASACLGASGTVRAVTSVIGRLGEVTHVMGSACGTWVDRAEALGLQRSGRHVVLGSEYETFGEAFSATPLLGIADVLANGSLPPCTPGLCAGKNTRVLCKPEPVSRFTSLCTDWNGGVTGVNIERLGRRVEASA